MDTDHKGGMTLLLTILLCFLTPGKTLSISFGQTLSLDKQQEWTGCFCPSGVLEPQRFETGGCDLSDGGGEVAQVSNLILAVEPFVEKKCGTEEQEGKLTEGTLQAEAVRGGHER